MKIVLAVIVSIFLGAAACVPFYFESQSLHYKFGMDKILLQAGKIFGLFALVLMLIQIFLTSRFSFLENTFSLRTLFFLHRIAGIFIGGLILLHPLFILASEHFTFFTFELRYWPEFLGVGLAVFTLVTVLISAGQKRFGIIYKTWQFFHRIGTPLILIMAFVHVRWVSESFELPVPKTGLYICAAIAGVLLARIYFYRFIRLKKKK